MKFGAALVFLLAFQVEIHVRAGAILQPVGEPEHCWVKSSGACIVQAGSKTLALKSESVDLSVSDESVLSRETQKPVWRFVKGSVRARTDKPGRLAFPQGEVRTENGEFWIIEEGDHFVVRAVRGELTVQTRDGRSLAVSEGLELWVGGYSVAGTVSHGVPSLIPIEDHLRRWAALNDEPSVEFVAKARELRERWKDRAVVAAALYDQVSQRKIASIRAEEERVLESHRAEQERRARNRAMLMEHAFGR